MGIYWDDKICGISWYKYDSLSDDYHLVYEYKSYKELTDIEKKEIKQNLDIIQPNYSDYIFRSYQLCSTTYDLNSKPSFGWNKINISVLINYLNM